MNPLILLGIAGAVGLFLFEKKKTSGNYAPTIAAGTGGVANTVKSSISGRSYSTVKFPAVNGSIKVVVTLIGKPTNWATFTSDVVTGKRTLLNKGAGCDAQTLTDFAVS